MTSLKDEVSYYIVHDGEEYLVEDSLTVGRHLDNDVMVAGEDVLDYHARVQLSDRGLQVHPLLDATVTIHDRVFNSPVSVTALDEIWVGQESIHIEARVSEGFQQATEWELLELGENSSMRTPLPSDVAQIVVGRAPDAQLHLEDDHISRQHALLVINDVVWLRDLGSANGTYVNAQRLLGSVRLFHGDQVSFDRRAFRLIGRGPDLTPINALEERPPPKVDVQPPKTQVDTTEMAAVAVSAEPDVKSVDSNLAMLANNAKGICLIGMSAPVQGNLYPLEMGTISLGRDPDCDLVINDHTVSNHHAQIIARAEGCTLTNLMATNGTSVNDEAVTTQMLNDGDEVLIGHVKLLYRNVPATAVTLRPGTSRWVLGAAILGALALGLYWLIA